MFNIDFLLDESFGKFFIYFIFSGIDGYVLPGGGGCVIATHR